ncbi:MAG TPA: 30S ribosomal protein S6 [Spirochaetaceae bacterium]|nr:30S ribosomal protein S6 [Spirochaetaceae bacterium]
MRKKYELTVIYREAEDERKEGIEFLEGVLGKYESKIITRNELGIRKFAYDIQKCQRGFYVFYMLELDGCAVAKIMCELNMSHLLLRYLFVEKEDPTQGQIEKRKTKERKMRDFLARKARNSAPAASTVPDKDKEAEMMELQESEESEKEEKADE